MPDLTISGSSDDLIEIEGVISDEFNYINDPCHMRISSPDGRSVRVTVEFDDEGCWAVALHPDEEDKPGYAGTVLVTGYTTKLTLDVPDDVSIELLNAEHAS